MRYYIINVNFIDSKYNLVMLKVLFESVKIVGDLIINAPIVTVPNQLLPAVTKRLLGLYKGAYYVGGISDSAEMRDCASFAGHVYGDYSNNILPTGTTILQRYHSQNDLRAVVYEYKDLIICAFAGSKTIKDWANNATQLVGLSQQYEEARDFAKEIVSQYGTSKVLFVGHSQGGGEAVYCACCYGANAVIFNPAALSFPTKIMGMTEYTQNAKITTVVFSSDVLDFVQSLVKMPYTGELWYVTDGNFIENGIHGMKGILKYFKILD